MRTGAGARPLAPAPEPTVPLPRNPAIFRVPRLVRIVPLVRVTAEISGGRSNEMLTMMALGEDRRRARQIRIRQEVRRILVDFREAERDRRRPEFNRPRPVRTALLVR